MELDERVRTDLAARTRFSDVRLVAETGSTNRDVAVLAAAGSPEGLVVVADHQFAGRGRLDRSWEARPGDGLLASVLLRPGLPVERRHLVTAAVALAAQEAVAAVGVDAEIKWPNDLIVGPAKLAGVLAEAFGEAVVVGLGLNVHGGPPAAAVLDDLAGRRVDRVEVLVAWLEALEKLVGDWDEVAASYLRRCATVGRLVRVELSGGEVLEGRAEAIDADGRLVVRAGQGPPRVVAVGDVSHLR